MPRSTSACGGRPPTGSPSKRDLRRAAPAATPAMRPQERRLAGAVGADDRHRLALGHLERDAEERLEVAVERAIRLADARAALTSTLDPQVDALHLGARHHRVRRPVHQQLRAEVDARRAGRPPSSSACTMCSIQTIATPRRADAPDHVDQLVHLVLGQAAGDLVEQQHARPRWRARAPAPAACARAGSARRRSVFALAREPGQLERVDAGRVRPRARPRRRRRSPRPARSRTRSVASNGCGIWCVRAMPARQRACGGKRGDVPAVEDDAPASARRSPAIRLSASSCRRRSGR